MKKVFPGDPEILAQRVFFETIKLLNAVRDQKGQEYLTIFNNKLLTSMIAYLVMDALTHNKGKLKRAETQYNRTVRQFTETKVDIQDAVALGFGGAMTTYSGKEVDYMCQITPIAEPQTKLYS